MSGGEHRQRKLLRTVETDTMRWTSIDPPKRAVVRCEAGAGTRQRSESVAGIMKKVRNFFRKPLDKLNKMCYNTSVLKREEQQKKI
jgi:hypothetical protein